MQRTALYQLHVQQQAKLVDFSGWEMPLHYGSQLQEHHRVRKHAGIFDVSHMGVVDIVGDNAAEFLRHLMANDINKLKENNRALYTCMLNPKGGIIDDLIVYRLQPTHFRLVINAGTKEKDLNWLNQHATHFDNLTVSLQPKLCILAIQGPQAVPIAATLLTPKLAELKPFSCLVLDNTMIARTGYTGEDGVEVILPAEQASQLWQQCLSAGVSPCGLGARDTLRLEAGLNLYGHDMDETTSPLVSNLSWTVSFKDPAREFIGKPALVQQKEHGIAQKLCGIVMTQAGVLRDEQTIMIGSQTEGRITSGGFSPTLGHAIALARVPADSLNEPFFIERRGKKIPLILTPPPFVKKGQKNF